MLSSTFVALVGFVVSATAVQIQSQNAAFFNAGIQGCVAVADNEAGSPLIIHNCNTENLQNQDWEVSFFIPTQEDGPARNVGPQQIKIFGDKCIDVTNGANADGTKLQIWDCVEGSTNQQWISVTDATFQWSGTNKCIDLTDGKITDSNVLQLWTCDGANTNQKWIGGPNPDTSRQNIYVLSIRRPVHLIGGDSSAGGGGPYCIAAASDTNGAEVALVACLNTDFHTVFPNGNITWNAPEEPLTGPIQTFANKCLDVPNGSTANGVKLQVWDCVPGNTNQLFKFHPGVSQIEWNGKGKCVDLTDGKSTSGNPLQLWDCVVPDNNRNQDWFRASI
ncbi:ricin B lectin domain-containing protein [Favolaschia claudopus]|uniref:Ricin B lectin domain-containing protein n=1 Tax=Favolaschia claudopus TaxID=2862362 RepID=A0AAW0DRU3_9AGAR